MTRPLWTGIIAAGTLMEFIALRHGKLTLSEFVRSTFKSHKNEPLFSARRVLLAVSFTWLWGHFVFGIWNFWEKKDKNV